jgi:hypothetical protein
MTPEEFKFIKDKLDQLKWLNFWQTLVIIWMIFITFMLSSCSSYEVVKKTSCPRYEPTKERHGGGKTTLE